MLLELVPITIMYAVVLMFRIRATAAPLVGLVFFSHMIYNTMRGSIPLYISIYTSNRFTFGLLQLGLFLNGVWNLRFVRFFIPPYCIGEDVKNIHAYALEYVPAFYPLFLVFMTYVFIELHDRNISLFVWLWKPFHVLYVLREHGTSSSIECIPQEYSRNPLVVATLELCKLYTRLSTHTMDASRTAQMVLVTIGQSLLCI